ncbi:MAG: N-acetyltransferase family protein [Thermodesulfobacteriota bacterium]
MQLTIRPMTEADWMSVREIYTEGLATGQASFETDAPAWERWNASHHGHSRLVAWDEDGPAGWAALAPGSDRACYAGVAEVSIYVAARCRGRGIGRRLLQEVIASSEDSGIWMLYASTFPENGGSLKMQESCGFRRVGVREKIALHHGVWRDTVLYERRSKLVGTG